MYRLSVSLLAISFCFMLLCSCGDNLTTATTPVICFTADACIECADINTTAKVTSGAGQNIRIQLLTPDSVSNITYELKNSVLTISRDELKCITSSDYLSDQNPQQVIIDTLISVAKSDIKFQKQDKNFYVYYGTCRGGQYILYIDKDTGYIRKIQSPYANVTVTFSKVKNQSN